MRFPRGLRLRKRSELVTGRTVFQKAMKQEHLTDQQVAAYQERDIESGERQMLDRHLAACAACLRRVVDTEHMDVAFGSLTEAFLPSGNEESFHLSRAELKRYAAGSLDRADRIIFDSHLEDCAQCSGGARELLSIKPKVTTLRKGARSGYAPQSIWGGFTDALRRLSWLRPIHVGGIALATMCALVGMLWVQSKFSDRRNQSSAPQAVASGGQDQNQSVPVPQTDHSGTQPPEETTRSVDKQANPEDVGSQKTPPSSQQTQPPAAPEIIVSLTDGNREVMLDKGGNLTGLEGTPVPIQRAVKAALSGKEMERPKTLDEIAAPRITLLDQSSDGTPFALRSPVGVVVMSDRPTFHWQPLTGAASYTVSVFDSNFNRITKSEPQSTTQWTMPTPLQRGRIYFWEVTALEDGQEVTSPVAPAPRAQFKTLEEEKIREINGVKKTRAGSHLVLGILYTRAGLLDDAEREFQLLVNANPHSEAAKTLLSRVQSWKRS